MLKIRYFLLLILIFSNYASAKEAVCKLIDRSNGRIDGEVRFTQADEYSPTRIYGKVVNLKIDAKQGFHVHEFADFSNKCTSAGKHYNPYDKEHGSPSDLERHVGDMGNLMTNNVGDGVIDYEDRLITLFGDKTIIGRACVVHQLEDDLGRGGHSDSKSTGHAGDRLACGEIVEVSESGSGVISFFFLVIIGLAAYYFCIVRRRNRYMQMRDDSN